jgi:hypothetical protein
MITHVLDDDLKLQRHQRLVFHDHDLSRVPWFQRHGAGI